MTTLDLFDKEQKDVITRSILKWGDVLEQAKGKSGFDVTVLGDISSRLDLYDSAIKLGIITKEDIRTLEGVRA